MKQLINVLIYKAKAARSLGKARTTTSYNATYWYQRYVYYTNKLEEM